MVGAVLGHTRFVAEDIKMRIRGYGAVVVFLTVFALLVLVSRARAEGLREISEAPELVKKMREARAALAAEPLEKEIEVCRKIRGQKNLRCIPFLGEQNIKKNRSSTAGAWYRLRSVDFLLRVKDGDSGKTIRLRQMVPPSGGSGFLFEVVASDFECDLLIEHIGGIGISRRYAVACENEDETMSVLAASYLTFSGKNKFSSPAELESKLRRITYFAFSDEYVTSEMVAYGDSFARVFLNAVFTKLEEKKIVSRAYPNRFVSEVYDRNLPYILLVSEHCDHGEFDAWGAEFCVKKVLTTIALNEGGVYPTMNRSGAAGVMQITNNPRGKKSGTYDMVRSKYPEAGLIQKFPEGAYDFENALMTAVLLLDYELSQLPQLVRNAYEKDPRSAVLCLAAAYHSGGGPAADICARPAKTISLDGFAYPNRFKKARPELGYYLRKFIALEKLPTLTIEAEPL